MKHASRNKASAYWQTRDDACIRTDLFVDVVVSQVIHLATKKKVKGRHNIIYEVVRNKKG